VKICVTCFSTEPYDRNSAAAIAQPEISASGRKVFGLAIAGVRLA
jgi:hypothetical protein